MALAKAAWMGTFFAANVVCAASKEISTAEMDAKILQNLDFFLNMHHLTDEKFPQPQAGPKNSNHPAEEKKNEPVNP